MGHFCRFCCRSLPNERFSGRGHRIHVCKECQRIPREERKRIEHLEDLHGFLHQSNISAKNVARIKTLTEDVDRQVSDFAALMLDIARVHPRKRKRWLRLAQHHRQLFDRAVELLGVEFFEEQLVGYGDFESPLWRILRQHRIHPPWTARACDCGSGRSFRDCCLERENDWVDQRALEDCADTEVAEGNSVSVPIYGEWME